MKAVMHSTPDGAGDGLRQMQPWKNREPILGRVPPRCGDEFASLQCVRQCRQRGVGKVLYKS